MAYEQSTSERNLSSIGRRQALCTFAGISAAVAGFALLGVGTARAAESTTDSASGTASGTAPAQTVTAQEVANKVEVDAEAARQLAMVEALIPKNLELGSWSIQKVQAPMFGAIPVVMRTPAGESFQVDVLARASDVSGIADTKHFSLFVANNGSGSKSTDELQARGAKILAHHLSRTERSGTPLPSLLTLVERSSQHPFGTFGVLG
jgi:predicted RNA-binding protein with TRAM domain